MLYVLAAIAAMLFVFFVVWPLASRLHALPCPAWLRWCVELDNPFARENRAAAIVGHLDLRPGMRVLDLGCGPGRLTIPLARRVGPDGEVVAADIQSGMLDRVGQKARQAGLDNIVCLKAGAGGGEGELGAERFDRAVLVTVLGEIPKRETAMREIFDALKRGGVLSITETVFDPHYQRRATVERIAQGAGFCDRAFFGNRIAYTMHFEKPAVR